MTALRDQGAAVVLSVTLETARPASRVSAVRIDPASCKCSLMALCPDDFLKHLSFSLLTLLLMALWGVASMLIVFVMLFPVLSLSREMDASRLLKAPPERVFLSFSALQLFAYGLNGNLMLFMA